MPSQDGLAQRFFGEHAAGYAKSPSHAHGEDLAALVHALRPNPSDSVLDVATGTGFTAAALAPHVKHVTGIDLTREMLVEARKLAVDTSNIEYELGDALDLSFPDSSIDIVTTRRASHHFQDVPRFLREARRVLRPGGRLGVVDMSPPEGAESFSNAIEKLRDSSHVEAFTPGAWSSMVSATGLDVTSSQVLGERVSFDRWLYPVLPGGKEAAQVRRAWGDASPAVKGLLQAEFAGGAIRHWVKSRIVLIARNPPSA